MNQHHRQHIHHYNPEEAKHQLQEIARDHVEAWRQESESGLQQVVAPPQDPSRANAWLTLAGNLVWAATSLVPESDLCVVLMSFGGAGVPAVAGLAETYQDPEPPEIGINRLKFSISQKLAWVAGHVDTFRLADRAYRALANPRNPHFTEHGEAGDTAREGGLWNFMFSVPYDGNRRLGIQMAAKQAAEIIVNVVRQLFPRYEAEIARVAQMPGTAGRAAIGLQSAYAMYGVTMTRWVGESPIRAMRQLHEATHSEAVTQVGTFDEWLSRQPQFRNLFPHFRGALRTTQTTNPSPRP